MFRQARNKDIPAIKNIVFSVLDEYGLRPDPGEADSDLSDIEASYLLKGGYFEVCEAGDEIVGTCGLYPLSAEECELRKMYLLPAQRGKGIGRAFVKRAIDKARALKFKKIKLETSSSMIEAISLYKKFGFRSVPGNCPGSRCNLACELSLTA